MTAILLTHFEVWQASYAAAVVEVRVAGTTTKATLYTDPAMSDTISNPVTLDSLQDAAGVTYGRWPRSIYVNEAVELYISSRDTTGVVRPYIAVLTDEDATDATVIPDGGSEAMTIAEAVSTIVHARAFGPLTEDGAAADNTTTIAAAIGNVATRGGGFVLLPPGGFSITTLAVPEGVILQGHAHGATQILSQTGAAVVTIEGNDAGLRDIRLNGVASVSGSVGVEIVGITRPVLERVWIKSFERGIRVKGATDIDWQDVVVEGCTTAADIRGDVDSGGGSGGDAVTNFTWRGGRISDSTTASLLLECVDRMVETVRIEGVRFISNIGAAASIKGAREVVFSSCVFEANTAAFAVADGSNSTYWSINTARNIVARDCYFSAGTMTFTGTCKNVAFERCAFVASAITLTSPTYPVLLQDCVTDATTTIAGSTLMLHRQASADMEQKITGVTTDATAATAWSYTLQPGEVVLVEAHVIGRQRNGTETFNKIIAAGIIRDPAVLTYANLTAAFNVGALVTGATSGASGRILAKTTVGTDGTLSLRDVDGTFLNGETITDSGGGSGQVNGSISSPSAAVDDVGVTVLRAMGPTTGTYAATIDVSSGAARVRVTGAASETVDWTVHARVFGP